MMTRAVREHVRRMGRVREAGLDVPLSAQGSYSANASADAENAREDQTAGAAIKVAQGKPLNQQDAVAIAATAATAMGGPAAGAIVAAEFEVLMVIGSGMQAVFKALGLDAHGVEMCSKDQPPPSGPNDPRWAHVALYPDRIETNASACPYPPCSSSQPFTTDMGPGSFEAFAGAALAANFELWVNCRASLGRDVLLQGIVKKWNAMHRSDRTRTYVAWDGQWQYQGSGWNRTAVNPPTYVEASMHGALPGGGDMPPLTVNMGDYVPPPLRLSPGALQGIARGIAADEAAKRAAAVQALGVQLARQGALKSLASALEPKVGVTFGAGAVVLVLVAAAGAAYMLARR